ncbi:hypothetical protein C2G38_2085277 [Gigaspora rosea]|uniref:Uncharacterized protein n=1 Tax=Gigaspora rosea TaxID=44941 RepID=A0A397V827_9GLOM|nr:hypothetical protein C2G38_2085277 [Gigaspora rosea]
MNSTKETGTLPYKETQDLTEEKRLDFRRDVITYEPARTFFGNVETKILKERRIFKISNQVEIGKITKDES